MTKEIIFEELGKKERILLLRAFDYDVDEEGCILDTFRARIPSKENPNEFLRVEAAALTPGSLEVRDGTPSSISRFIRELEEK